MHERFKHLLDIAFCPACLEILQMFFIEFCNFFRWLFHWIFFKIAAGVSCDKKICFEIKFWRQLHISFCCEKIVCFWNSDLLECEYLQFHIFGKTNPQNLWAPVGVSPLTPPIGFYNKCLFLKGLLQLVFILGIITQQPPFPYHSG